jgi:tetratricopeptide (TPR) repeat protein
VVIYYISLLILPHPSRLNLDYDFSLSYSLVNPVTTLFAIAALAGLIGLTVYLAKKERILSFCILWFLGNLVIESSVIGLAIIFEHRLYLPSMFFCLMAVLLIYRYIKPKWMSVLLFCMITFFCSVWTYERNIVWSSSYKLWADCVEKSPEKARPHNNLGLALIERGEVVDAIRHYTEALQIAPDFLEAYNNLGLALVETGRINEAIAHYSKVLQLNPDHAIVRYNLGIALAKLGRVAEAVAQFQKIFQIRPDFEDPYANFGVTLVKKGKIDEAAGFFRNVLRTKPDFAFARGNIDATLDASIKRYAEMLRKNPDDTRAHVHLGVVLTKQNRTAEAVAHYNKALQIKPGYVEAHNNMGIALVKQGRTTEAVKHYNEVLRINPNYVKTLNNLGLALMVQGRTVEAVEHLQEALRIKPDYAKAQYNLGVVLQRPDIQVGSS